MLRILPLAAFAFVLTSCTEPDRVQTTIRPSVAVIGYPLSVLPMTDRTRTETVMSLTRFSLPRVKRACSPEERQFLELSLILYSVGYEEWRTAPWSPRQRREVNALRHRWQSLGGDSRTVSGRCQAAIR